MFYVSPGHFKSLSITTLHVQYLYLSRHFSILQNKIDVNCELQNVANNLPTVPNEQFEVQIGAEIVKVTISNS